ncbi:MAG: hypothetical protein ABIH23_26705 [bacterium]
MSKRSSGYTSLMGMVLEGGRMKVVVLRRSGTRYRVKESFQAPLSLDPLTHDPELVGREIRNHLDGAGIRDSRCVVCVPLKWALTMQTELPDLSEPDTQSYLTVQSERGFPFAPEDLSLSISRFQTPGGDRRATLVAIPKNHLRVLEKVLKAARLRPISITLGITSLHEREDRQAGARITLFIGEDSIDLAISTNEGLVSLRTFEEPFAENPDGEIFDADLIAKQIRITLGQLPQDLRDTIRTVQLFGPSDLTDLLLNELRDSAAHMGMTVECGNLPFAEQFIDSDEVRKCSQPALGATLRRMLGKRTEFEFLPPRTSRFKQMTGRVLSRGTLWLGGSVATLLLCLVAAFVFQYWRLSTLESQWQSIESDVTEVEGLQEKIRKFRPWFNQSIQSLTITQKLTEAFPEEGDVWLKTLEINNLSEVYCSGFARSNREWLKMLDRIRETKQVDALQVRQIRGDNPLQFTLSFRWNEGTGNGL